QNAFQTQSIGQQILAAQPVPPSPPSAPDDPQNSHTPKTQIQSHDVSTTKIEITSNDSGHTVDVKTLPPLNAPPTIPLVLLPPPPPLLPPNAGPNVAPIALNVGINVTEANIADAHEGYKFVPAATLLDNAADANGDHLTVSAVNGTPIVIEHDPGLCI